MKIVFASFLAALALVSAALAAESRPDVSRQLWQLLDYIAVDYGGAVKDGAVIEESEFGEMREFASAVATRLADLPGSPVKGELTAKAANLEEAINRKATADEVAALARQLADELLVAYPFDAAPRGVPDLLRGARLFAENCASCHGATGAADGPLAAKLTPRPVAFTDRARARERSVLALYQAVSQGVTGTSMPAFQGLSDADRWSVAYFAGSLSNDEATRKLGARRWQAETAARAAVPDLGALSRFSEATLASVLGEQSARETMAFLRANPGEVARGQQPGVAFVKAKVSESATAYRRGDKSAATRLALSAYLDGFEPLEPSLAAHDRPLLAEVEASMMTFRAAVAGEDRDKVDRELHRLESLLERVESALSFAASDWTTAFVGSLTILLREGVEALLVVVGMVAFLRKAGRPDVLRHVHFGWIGALAAGAMTWLVATYLVGISGASREVTEGASSLFAAVVLLGVGLWMHQKSAAGRWQAYLRDKLSHALGRKSAFALGLLAFVAVYREVFETVLFFSALWTEGNGTSLLAGIGTGSALLALLAWALLRTSAKMPIGRFFAASSVIVAVLAFVLAGKGIKALQEAGVLVASPLHFPGVEWLGIYPTDETLLAQLAVVVIAAVGFWLNSRARPGVRRQRA